MKIATKRTLTIMFIGLVSIFAVLSASPKSVFQAIGENLQRRIHKKPEAKLSSNSISSPAMQSSSTTFVLTGAMKEKRVFHAATLLNNGWVLVTGGNDGPTASKTAELYDLLTATWRYTKFPMNSARSGHTATLLPDGRVLIAGGSPETNTAEIYDPVAETFTTVKPMNVTRMLHRAILLKDGRVLVIAGRSSSGIGAQFATNATEIYDPATGNWSLTDPLPFAVTDHAATLLPNGTVLVTGGYDGFRNDAHIASVALYDPATGKWKMMADMQVRRTYHTATLLANGKVLIAGGNTTSTTIDSTEIYDPAAGTNGQSALGNSVKVGGWGSRAARMNDGKVLLIGGEFISGTATSSPVAHIFNPATSTFTDIGPMNAGRAYADITILPSGQVLITGGQESGGVALASAEIWGNQNYDVVRDFSIISNPTGTWSYGYSNTLGSLFTLYTDKDVNVEQPGIERWFLLPDMNPSVNRNTTNAPLTGKTGSNTFPPDMLLLHPGPAGQYSIVRWTVPAAGTYKIEGMFKGLDIGSAASTDNHIRLNSSTSLFSTTINSFGETKPFSLTRTFAANDKIDFAVGYGDNQAFQNDSTGLSATITSITETCIAPTITAQPIGKTISSGEQATLTVGASGTEPRSYQWYEGAKGDTSKPVGTNSSSFTTPALTVNKSYWVRVSNSCGEALSDTTTISVGQSDSLSGRIGIWDGKTLWKLDGDGIESIQVHIFRIENSVITLITGTVDRSTASYKFNSVPPGNYNLVVKLKYKDRITVDNQGGNTGTGGCGQLEATKTVEHQDVNIQIPSADRHDIHLRVPIVMVHGHAACYNKWFNTDIMNTDYWDNAARIAEINFEKKGFITFTPNYHFVLDADHDWEVMASEVKEQIENNFKGLTRQASDQTYPPWFYIGHSQGGLVGRVLVSGANRDKNSSGSGNSSLIDSLRKMYLLGTPNSGVLGRTSFSATTNSFFNLSSPPGFLSEDTIQRGFNFTYPDFSEKDVTVYAGNIGFFWDDIEDHDGAVSIDSVHNIRRKTCIARRLRRDTCTNPSGKYLDGTDLSYTHTQLGSSESRYEILINRILPETVLAQSVALVSPNTETPSVTTSNVSRHTTTLQSTAALKGLLASNQTQTKTFIIGAADLIQINAFVSRGSATFALVNPSGQMIDFTALHPAAGIRTFDEFGEKLVLKNPVPGQWVLKVIAGNSGATFDVHVAENSPFRFEGYVTETTIQVGQNARLLGQWANNARGLTHLSVTAQVFDELGQLFRTVELFDDGAHQDGDPGDGIFASETPQISNSGRYTVLFTAQSDFNGQPFTRIVKDFVDVLPHTHLFTGSFSDRAYDKDLDGKNDHIQENIGISVAFAGSYLVTADLQDAQGYFIDHAVGYLRTGTAGSFSVNLDFKMVRATCAQYNTGFTVSNLTLLEAGSFKVLDIWSRRVITQAYTSDLFTCIPGIPTPRSVSAEPGAMFSGSSGQVFISGNNFADGVRLSLGAGVTISSVTYGNSNLIFAQVSVSAEAIPGPRDVIVTNPDGRSSTASGIFAVASDQSPSIAISYPANQQVVQGLIIASASVSDDKGVQKVEFYVDGKLSATDTTFPYQFPWESYLLGNGTHTLEAKAYDTSGQSATAQVTVTLSNSLFEGDVSPRPLGNGNGTVTMADWVQLGRFYIGLDPVMPGSEFQRADCYPKETKGDGKITIGDWVQAGRYAAGLDPVVPVGGQTTYLATLPSFAAKFSLSLEAQARNIRIRNANFLRGQIGTMQIELEAQGNENATAFSLNYDPRLLTFVDAKAGSDVNGAVLQINRAQSVSGRLGFALVLAPGQQLAAGIRTLVSLRFIPSGGDGVVATNVSFSDQLLAREVVDQFAAPITAVNYTSGTITISGRAAANVSAASYADAELAADSIASAFGMNLATMTTSAISSPLPTTLGGTTVRIKDSLGVERSALLFFVSPNQINYQIPIGTADGIASVTITNGLGEVTSGLLNTSKVAPGLFTADSSGKGWAAADVVYVKPDQSQVIRQVARFDVGQNRFVPVPIDLSTDAAVLVLYGTGVRHRAGLANVKVKIDGLEAEIDYADRQGQFAGLDQINVRLPKSLAGRGEVNVEVSVEGKPANTIRIMLQ